MSNAPNSGNDARGRPKALTAATLTTAVVAASAALVFCLSRLVAARRKQRSLLANRAPADHVRISVGSRTQYILSTSGRHASCERYRILLEDILGLDAAYLPISSTHADGKIRPKQFTDALRGLNCIGGAISRDIKGTVAGFLDEIDPLALEMGAVNTVVVKQPGSRLVGHNTDAAGFAAAIEAGLRAFTTAAAKAGNANSAQEATVQRAVCYGYGGVTAVVVAVLRRMGIECRITGRRRDAAVERAAALGVKVFTGAEEPKKGGKDEETDESITAPAAAADPWKPQLFVNAAPVTDAPLEQAIGFLEALRECTVVFDHELQGSYVPTCQ